MIGRLNREGGFAMITALLVSLVVASLGIVVVSLSVHNTTASALDRKRMQAVAAAEAGVNAYFSLLQSGTGAGTCSPMEGTLNTSPGAHYRVEVQLYSTWPPSGSPLPCPPPTGTDLRGALVSSRGTAVQPGQGVPVSRTMQTGVRLTPVYRGLGQAIFSNSQLNFQNQLTVNGDQANDADVYTNGNFTMQNNTVIGGNVYAQGTVTINQGIVRESVWGNGAVGLSSLQLYGNATSSTSSIALHNTRIYGSARAGTTITLSSNSQIDGTQVSNSPSGPPPQLPFPQVTFNEQAWRDAGYTILTYSDCTTARAALLAGGPAGERRVLRVAATCQIRFGNNTTIPVNGDTAVVTDGSFLTENRVTFEGSGQTLQIIVPYRAGLACSPSPSPYDITVSNLTRFNDLKLLAYSQCTVNFGNNNAGGVNGQIIGGVVNITNQMTLNYRPVLVPGNNLVGYTVDVSYLREVQNGV